MSKLYPEIYVACLATYNEGQLYGKWIDANQDADTIREEIKEMLANSPISNAGEWAIHDCSNFGNIKISEYSSIEEISQIAEFIEEHGELGAEIIASTSFNNLEDAKNLMDSYSGEYSSKEDFAYDFTNETLEIPKYLEGYVDYKKMARDLFISDYFSIELNGKTHVFSQNY